MATKGSKIHKVTRTVTLVKTFDDDGVLVEVVVRRLRPTTILTTYKGIPGVVDEQTRVEVANDTAELSQDERVAEAEKYVAIADVIICAAAVEPRFYAGEMPVGGDPELWADIEALHEEDRVMLVGVIMEMAGLSSASKVVTEDAALSSFPDADTTGRGDGG